ncbi:hypothetical protein D9Q98_001393 [Chlorella vulgaris]|uniref:Uncharacterized protein n=1 Tax=Chlorella vulgaris TaxID=3077 RepID=A0A9D4TZY3_CHLVU|nr:hypothetical protein D9Q98_001393 [Chlorella vulgaris]
MAYQQTEFRVCVEFLRSSKPGSGRIIRLNYSPDGVPPQLVNRIHPAFWSAFMTEAGQLSLRHPYVATPQGKHYLNWASCFAIGAVVGLFCISPDAGDYGLWNEQCRQFIQRWSAPWQQAGCTLSLQRHRDFWLQIDIEPSPPPAQPFAPPLPPPLPAQQQAAPAGSNTNQQALDVPAGKPPKAI